MCFLWVGTAVIPQVKLACYLLVRQPVAARGLRLTGLPAFRGPCTHSAALNRAPGRFYMVFVMASLEKLGPIFTHACCTFSFTAPQARSLGKPDDWMVTKGNGVSQF